MKIIEKWLEFRKTGSFGRKFSDNRKSYNYLQLLNKEVKGILL